MALQAFDVVILGAGPAGAAAAAALARAGLAVALLQRPGPGPPGRVETLASEVHHPLAELGLWGRFQAGGHLASPGTVSIWGGPEPIETDAVFDPSGAGWHVDRSRFDAMLVEAAIAAGVSVRPDVRLDRLGEGSTGRWELTGVFGGRRQRWRAGFLIDATGRAALAARRLGGPRMVIDRLVALVGLVAPDGSPAGLDRRLLVEAVEDGWWYTAPLPDGHQTLCAFLTDPDLIPRGPAAVLRHWRSRLDAAPGTARRCAAGAGPEVLRVAAAGTVRAGRVAGRGWLAAGDAAAALDPLCGQGVYRALESGLRASEAAARLVRGSPGALRDYAALVEDQFAADLRERSRYYGLERRWPDSPFWRRRAIATIT
jgi:flavin-dependent dehydrogenase